MAVRLFISNFPYNVTAAELKELFSAVGPVSYVYLPTDQATGKQRGFAFLDFSERAHAEEAVRRFDKQMFKGRPLAVSEARPREDRPHRNPTDRATPPKLPAQQQATDQAQPRKAGGNAFFTDDQPQRSRNKPNRSKDRGKAKTERAPKAPMREVVKGQFFGGDDDDLSGEDLSAENFASRVKDGEGEENR